MCRKNLAHRGLRARGVVCFIAIAVAGVAVTVAGEVNLSWDASAGASGYRVFSGPSPGSYGSPDDVGGVTTKSIATMPDCATTHFAVKAYNGAGESGFSQEVASWPRPVLSSINNPNSQRGQTLDLVIGGVNFQPGSSVQFSAPGIVVNNVSIGSCNQLTANVTVQNSTPLGPVDILVANASGVVGSSGGLFSIAGDPLPNVDNLRRTDTTNN